MKKAVLGGGNSLDREVQTLHWYLYVLFICTHAQPESNSTNQLLYNIRAIESRIGAI